MPYKKATPAKKGMVVVYSGDSSVLIKKDGTLAWRNNNPGNLISGPFAKRQGAIGDNKGFAVFETLRREDDKVYRIEKDGSTRGYFISE
jgi:hypothetical protein